MLTDIIHYTPPIAENWQGRQDTSFQQRFFQYVNIQDIRTTPLPQESPYTLFLGFCSDEGIRRNEGRLGAKTGPKALRQQLAKLPFHGNTPFLDIGDIVCDNDLESAQKAFAKLTHYCHRTGHTTIALGGGHEIAWAHFQGLIPFYPNLGIINFDAHFDLRTPTLEHQGTSGTPFWQINQYCKKNNLPFNYCCVGIQPHSNTKHLFSTAQTLNVPYLTAEQISTLNFSSQTTFLDHFIAKHDTIYLSICLDVFAESVAPGVSAPQALGLLPFQVLPLLKYIMQSGKVVSLDIAELSPSLDHSQQTARLAAMIIAELIEINTVRGNK